MKRALQYIKIGLLASATVAILVTQIPNRRFFLSRIWQGKPTANLSQNPDKKFSLQRVQPGVKASAQTIDKAPERVALLSSDVPTLQPPRRAVPVVQLSKAYHTAQFITGPVSGRAPPR